MSFLEQDRLAGFARQAMDNKFAIKHPLSTEIVNR